LNGDYDGFAVTPFEGSLAQQKAGGFSLICFLGRSLI